MHGFRLQKSLHRQAVKILFLELQAGQGTTTHCWGSRRQTEQDAGRCSFFYDARVGLFQLYYVFQEQTLTQNRCQKKTLFFLYRNSRWEIITKPSRQGIHLLSAILPCHAYAYIISPHLVFFLPCKECFNVIILQRQMLTEQFPITLINVHHTVWIPNCYSFYLLGIL